MEKEKVLEIEFTPVFDEWAWRISYQDEEVFKRGEFFDTELDVGSRDCPYLHYGRLYIRGLNNYFDSKIYFCDEKEKAIIEEKVRLINEKYGKPKRWRAEKRIKYYTIDTDLRVSSDIDLRFFIDDKLYEIGNYFQTKEEAERVVEEIRKVFERAKRGEFRDERD